MYYNMIFLRKLTFNLILKNISPNAKEYLNINASQFNRNALNEFLIGKYKGVDFVSFNWVDGSVDRNWWWQVQQLPGLKWYFSSFDLLSKIERESGLNKVLVTFQQWYEKACNNPDSPLVWHDHVAVLRLRNLAQFLTCCVINKASITLPDEFQKLLVRVINKHIIFLLKESNYSKHTNHGFDQALDLYTICLMWNRIGFLKDAECIAKARLLDEIAVAFTEQGVHKENSPGYQGYMYQRLKVVQRLEVLGEKEVSQRVSELASRVFKFWQLITLPNGKLPLIGDTKIDDKGNFLKNDSKLNIFDYSESGYVIAKGITNRDKNYQLIFKNSHESNYHRHDDDLSCYIYYNEEVIFGDGGLYSYNENDNVRKFLRSPEAHNVTYPAKKDCIRDNRKLSNKPITYYKNKVITASSYSYHGAVTSRTVHLNQMHNGLVTLNDTFYMKNKYDKNIISNFFFPFHKCIYLAPTCAYIKTKRNFIKIKSTVVGLPADYKLITDIQEKVIKHSLEFNSLYKASRLVISNDIAGSSVLKHEIQFDIEDEFIRTVDEMELLGLTPTDFSNELWSMGYLAKANKETNLKLNNLLNKAKPEQLSTKVVYLFLRESLRYKKFDKVFELLPVLLDRSDVTSSQLLNGIYQVVLTDVFEDSFYIEYTLYALKYMFDIEHADSELYKKFVLLLNSKINHEITNMEKFYDISLFEELSMLIATQ